MKKKLILLPSILLSLSACNTTKVNINGDLTDNYTKVHIYKNNKCYNIKKWCNGYDTTYTILLDNDTQINIHKIDCLLISGKCPICESE